MSKRCDSAADCSDYFDEINCNIVTIDKQLYQKEFPPIQKDDTKTEIKVNATVFSLGGFNEIEMTFKMKFSIGLKW
jgi:hypothetical protein